MQRDSPTPSKRRGFHFTQLWFEKNIPRWTSVLSDQALQKISVLEIGSFEGASTTWILENLMEHPDSTMIAIDTFKGSIEHISSERIKKELDTLEQRFHNNVAKTRKADRLTVIKDLSQHALLALQGLSFDFIYVDGSHVARDVLCDAVLSWPLLRENGMMIFDDYKWDKYEEDFNNPRIAIDAFLNCYRPNIEVVYVGYQVFIKKMKAKDEA
jgi:predicted O-methyltransferase YrrM